MQVRLVDTSTASEAVRSALTKRRGPARTRFIAIGVIATGVAVAIGVLARQHGSTRSPETLVFIAATFVLGVIFAYRSHGSTIAQYGNLLSVARRRVPGPTAYSQWAGAGIGPRVTVPSFSSSLSDMLNWVDGYREARRGPRHRMFAAGVWRAFAGCIFVTAGFASYLAIPIVPFAAARMIDERGTAIVLIMITGITLGVAGSAAVKFGRMVMQPSARKAMSRDLRESVLWLRAFRDDAASVADRDDSGSYEERSLEEILTFELWYYGPVITIGAPGDRLPRLGAARAYFADSEWQNAVMHWMSSARLIVVVVGTTDWLRWEVEHLIRGDHLPKLLFVFPPDTASKRAARWLNTIRPFEALDGYQELSAVDVSLARIGFFKGGDTFVLLTDVAKDNVAYEVALRLAIYGLFHIESS